MKGEKQNMNKFITKLAKIFLGLSMAAGVGVALSAGRKDASPAYAATATMSYSGSTTNMGSGNNASKVGLSATDWTVTANKGGNTNYPGLNKSGYIALYYNATESNSVVVSAANSSWSVTSIQITFTSSSYNNVAVYAGSGHSGTPITGSSGSYSIGNRAFTLYNANTSNTQVRITSVVITYSTGSTTSYTVTYDPNHDSLPTTSESIAQGGHPAFTAPSAWTGHLFKGWKTDNDANLYTTENKNSYTVSGAVTFTAQWANAYTVTYNANGGSGTTTDSNSPYESGDTVTVVSNSFTHATQVFDKWNTSPDGNGTSYNPGGTFTMGSANVTLYAIWKAWEPTPGTDTLNKASTRDSGENYIDWSNVAGTQSSAIYAGNSGGQNNSIQLRSNNNNSGVVSTRTGGYIKTVILDWNTNTTGPRTIDVYVKDAAYSQATDLYGNNKGTLAGSITYTSSSDKETTLNIDGNHSYVGLRSNNGALYLNSITFVWSTEVAKSIDIGGAIKSSGSSSITAELTGVTGTPTWNASPNTGVSFTSGTTTTMTIDNSVPNGTVIEVTATISDTTSNTKKVVVSRHDGLSKNDSFDADEAVSLVKNSLFDSSTTYYVKGYVKTASYSEENSNTTLYITTAQNNSEIINSNCFEIYRGIAGQGVDISSISSGDFVNASGTMTLFSSTQAEFTQGCTILEVVGPEITALSVDTTNATTSFDIHSEFSSSGIVVTGTVNESSVTIPSTDYSVSSPDMDTAGQKTITVTYTGSAYSHSSTISTTYNITVVVPSPEVTIGLIEDIGEVEYSTDSYDAIIAARSSYNGLPAESKALVTNYQDLVDAETAWTSVVSDAVDAVEDAIDAIGSVTLSSGTAIDTARDAYDNLLAGDLGKNLVENYSILTSAESAYASLVEDRAAADEVEALIDALPAVSSITDRTYHNQIVSARTAYDALTASQKEMVDSTKYAKLEACETKDNSFVPSAEGLYVKLDNLSKLTNGAIVLITNVDGTHALSTTQNTNNRGATTGATNANESITVGDNSDIQAFEVETFDDNGTHIVAFKTINGTADKYLCTASGGNYLRSDDSVSANSKFTITLSNEGAFTAVAESSSYRNVMQYNTSGLFACYSSASQSAIAIYIKKVVNPDEVASVSLNATSLNVGLGSAIQLEASIYPDTALDKAVTWSTSDNTIADVSSTGVVSGVSLGGPVTITVTTHDGGFTATCEVTVIAMEYGFFYKISSVSELEDGDQIYFDIPLADNGGHKAANNLIAKKVETTAVDSGSLWNDTFGNDSISTARVDKNQFVWTVEADSNGFNFVDTNGDYLGMSKDSTDLSAIDSSEKDASCKWELNSGLLGGAFLITNSSYTSRSFGYQIDGGKLGAYANSNFNEGGTQYRTVDIYKLVTISNVDRLSGLECSGEGSYTGDWSSLTTAFNGLSLEIKAYYKHASYLVTGSGLETVVTATNNTDATIASFVAKYDDIVLKHGVTDFIGRSPTRHSGANPLLNTILLGKNTNTVAIIVIISMVSVTAIGGYFFLRKRKENI